ncbi:hypothetical protein VOLCADRAFT_96146 [Volvox carteri f. nagariensis]|uniref:Uncharacterized protein n=1 Tax=Volvox carteri f. nagariensis TaxID=3068 RepID=D8U9B9_VOLCA|nr:uncharacterized protein VOLCADRAFT_96146 [Volvox carteri f. nagariensis]EFJ43728.1 hypothetical protein VOLCADRAFT_96146 [Volvox carteri f. nagariensis]|eukprot:XP_002955209.1 hypothetical protein VOLCADRAFT_96146 [Volvox carteri f. nagariensis]
MDIQPRCENVLFTAPSLPANLFDQATTLQANTVGVTTKRPVSVFIKPNRNARLGAAAAAARAACDDNEDMSSDAELADSMLSPKCTSDAANANRVINSLLGTMPALPGSPTLESSDVPAAVRLIKLTSALSIFQRDRGSSLGTTEGGDYSSNPGESSPRMRPTKCHSERGGSSSIGSGATAMDGPSTQAAIAARRRRALARKSVDAAAGAVMLSTRQASELSLGPGTTAAALAADNQAKEEDAEEGVSAGSLSAAINAAAAAAADRARAGAQSMATAAVASITASSSVARQCSWHHNSIEPSRSTRTPPSPVSPLQNPIKSNLFGHKSAREWLQARGSAPGSTEKEEGFGALRQQEPEGKTRPRWLERLLRAFHAERVYRAGKVASGGSSCGHDCSRYSLEDDGRADGRYEDGSYGDQLSPGSSGGKLSKDEELASGITGDRPSRGKGGGAGTVKVDDDDTGRAHSAILRSPVDQLMAATRLLSSRGRRSRSGSDQRPPSVMTSRDSTTVHRARLAQQVRLQHAAVAPSTAPITYQQVGIGPRNSFGDESVPSEEASNTIRAVTAKGAAGSASVIGVSVTAFAHAAAASKGVARRPLATATTPITAAAFNFVRSIDVRLPQAQLCTPTDATEMHSNGRRGALPRPRLRQLSAPGGPEPKFTSLSQLETRSVDGATTADCGDSDVLDGFTEGDEGDDPSPRVALRAAGMIFPR